MELGRPRLFETVEAMKQKFIEYFEHCVNNPLIKNELVKTKEGADIVGVPIPKVFQKQGLALFCGFYSYEGITEYKTRLDKNGVSFSDIIAWAEATIYEQKFEYAAANILNHNIIAYDLGINKVQEIQTEQKPQITINVVKTLNELTE